MSDLDQETVADIVADVRERAENAMRNGERLVHNEAVADMLTFVADRIEAAAKREHLFPYAIKVPIEVVPTGNTVAVREALVSLRDAARNFCHQILNSKYNDMMDEYKCRERGFPALLDLRAAIPKANFALADPPRNCDVGTADEQDARFGEFCVMRRTGTGSCAGCPDPVGGFTVANGIRECALVWAQMPYSAEEGGAQ